MQVMGTDIGGGGGRSTTRTAGKDSGSQSAFTEEQIALLRELASNHNLSSAERNRIYAELVSDNYGSNNKTERYNDGTQVDVSEMTVLEKTKLSSGKFRTEDKGGERFDDFGKDAKVGDTKEVCGGTITYKGMGPFGANVDVDDEWLLGTKDYIAMTDEQRGTIVEYDGVLGHFTYNTREFELSYYEATQNGNTISVPVLHYKGDDPVDVLGFGVEKIGVTNGSKITIPDGLEIADYMFVDTDITSMPDISTCTSLKSAHCMFMNCKNMHNACDNAMNNDLTLKYPPNLEDISWMFAGSGMTQFFGELGEFTMDARCAAQDCTKMGYPYEYIPDAVKKFMPNLDTAECMFSMPNMGKARYLVTSYCDDMLDNTNTEVARTVSDYCRANGLEEDGVMHISAWTDEDGAHNCIFDKVEDGTYDQDRIERIRTEAEKRSIIKMIDPEASAETGLGAITNDMMTTATQLKDSGDVQNNTTWATLLQADKTFTGIESNPGGELVDRALAFGATYGILKGVTKNNWIAIGGAGAAQLVGFANKITPILDTVSGFLGEDNMVGGFLANISKKLKDKQVNYSTKVEELNVDKVFEDQQTSSVLYAYGQMKDVLKPRDGSVLPDEDGYIAGTSYDVSTLMRANGKAIAEDGNLVVIAMTPEATLKKNLDTKLMETAMTGLMENLREDAGSVMTSALKQEYSGYFMTLMYNLQAYSDGAAEEISDRYVGDESGEAASLNGLGKVMRNTCGPVYEAMAQAQKDYNLFSAEQLAELDTMVPEGMPKFSEYVLGQDLTPETDPYVDKLEEQRTTLKEALESATTNEEVNAAYKTYYEEAYGDIIREAERQGVVLDTMGAEVGGTQSSSFYNQVTEWASGALNRISNRDGSEVDVPDGGDTTQDEQQAGA